MIHAHPETLGMVLDKQYSFPVSKQACLKFAEINEYEEATNERYHTYFICGVEGDDWNDSLLVITHGSPNGDLWYRNAFIHPLEFLKRFVKQHKANLYDIKNIYTAVCYGGNQGIYKYQGFTLKSVHSSANPVTLGGELRPDGYWITLKTYTDKEDM